MKYLLLVPPAMLLFSFVEWWATYPAGTVPPAWLKISFILSLACTFISLAVGVEFAKQKQLQVNFVPSIAWGFFLLFFVVVLVRA